MNVPPESCNPIYPTLCVTLGQIAWLVAAFGLMFLIIPGISDSPINHVFSTLPEPIWGGLSLLTGALGLASYRARSTWGLVLFCFCATFVFSTSALALATMGGYTCTVVYLLIALTVGRRGAQILELKLRKQGLAWRVPHKHS